MGITRYDFPCFLKTQCWLLSEWRLLLDWGISVLCWWLWVHITTVVWPWDCSLSKSSPPIMQGNLGAWKCLPFGWNRAEAGLCRNNSGALISPEYLETAQSGHQLWAAWKSGPQHPLLLLYHSSCQRREKLSTHSSCQENYVRWETEDILRCNW